jgi:hypothetical protein
MQSFNDVVTHWQPFFNAIAGVAATLAGLLFVALSINRDKITGQKTRVFHRIARRSFGDLIFTLFIALLFLMPVYEPTTLGRPLLIPAAFRAFWVVVSVWRTLRGASATADSRKAMGQFREHAFSIISMVGLVVASIQICRGSFGAIFLLVPVTSLMLYNASLNAWQLLMMEKSPHDPA